MHPQHFSASQPTHQPIPHLPKPPPTGSTPFPQLSPINNMVGGTPNLFPYGKYTCVSQIPPSLSTTSPTPVPSW